MPVLKENRHLYPANWKAIREMVLLRSGDRCEGSPAYPDCRVLNYAAHPDTFARVVLTIAHLDHDPQNNDMDNLRSWCQRCHNTYDAPYRAANRRRRRMQRDTTASLLREGET